MAPPRRRPTGRARPPGPWKNGPIPVIGLVGGIGSGKSAAAARFGELGAFVIDADTVGHVLLDQKPVCELVVRRFGPGILDAAVPAGEPPRIDRQALGAIVFADPAERRGLESILHPRMRRTFEKAVARVARRGTARAVILDAAILFEAGWDALCDRVVFVDAPRPARLARLAAQRGWDEGTLAAREQAQWPLDRKRERAEAVIDNSADAESLRTGVDRVWSQLRPPARERPPSARTAEARGGPSPARGRRPAGAPDGATRTRGR